MSPPIDFGSDFGATFGSATRASVSNLITYLLTAVGVNSADTEYRNRTLVYLNFAYLNRLKGRHWKFSNRDLFIDLKAPYETGTVTLTENSYSVVEDTNPSVLQFNSTMIGQTFAPASSSEDFYRVATIPTGQSLTLASRYAGTTVTETDYSILFDRIQLETGVQAVRSVLLSGLGEIAPCGIQEFRNQKSRNQTLVGPPRIYSLVNSEKDTGQVTLELFPSPDKKYSCQIDYSVRPVGLYDSEECFTLIPPDQLDVLYYAVLTDLYRYQENTAMAESSARMAANSWARFASDQEMTDSVARVQHGRRYFNRGRSRYVGYYGLKWFGRVDD